MTQTRPMLRQQEDRGFAQHDLLENSRNPSEQCLVRHRQCVFPTEQALDDAMPDRTRKREQVSRSEEHTSELQSLMRISYAVFCLQKKNTHKIQHLQKNP